VPLQFLTVSLELRLSDDRLLKSTSSVPLRYPSGVVRARQRLLSGPPLLALLALLGHGACVILKY
jgi:hypothetical protein